jgi:hypothetical protein
MPSLTWNETRDRALKFSRTWATARHEEQDKQTFWNEFFDCFGIPRKSVAVFEHAVANVKGHYGFLDLFWPSKLLVEHKSRGAALGKAESQAFKYLEDLAREGRHDEMPRYIILCDFNRFALYDLEPEETTDLPSLNDGRRYRLIEFPLSELYHHVREFAFMRGEKAVRLDPDDPANFKATQLLAGLHDALESTGFAGHELERMLVRLLFCLFAEDTGIFDAPGCFQSLVRRTREDGSDLGPQLAQLFQVLNQPPELRQKNLDEDLAAFPYVNGGLFAESPPIVSFNADHRKALLSCCHFHWAKISPAVFGSLFQGIMDKKERRQVGAHYTSERDIMKLIRSLFLDDLRADLNAALADRSNGRMKRLQEFQKKLRSLKFFDPACGCGNFLILAYREIRRLENEALIAINTNTAGQVQAELVDIRELAQVDVDQFYGIEIGEWPVRIAEVGLWLTDHQCNMELAEALGRSFRRLPLKATPTLKVANSLQTDWKTFLPPTSNIFVLGNPPFVGKHYQSIAQKADMANVFSDFKNIGDMDYVAAWFYRGAEYIQGTRIRVAFVATNSITQGEQVPVVWGLLFDRLKVRIHFAHRTFAWASEARGKAHVHVVIIGFGAFDTENKRLYDHEKRTTASSQGSPTVCQSENEKSDKNTEILTVSTVKNISPYLTPGSNAFVRKRQSPLSNVPEMRCGNKPSDGGNLILTDAEYNELLREEPGAERFLRRYTGSEEYINGNMRWCLWLEAASPAEIRALPKVLHRVERVKEFRQKSSANPTRKAANTPARFFFVSQPSTEYILIPEVSSERRQYIPIGFLPPDIISSNKNFLIASNSLFHFGMLTSMMHMAWMRQVGGRLESRYQYSGSMVYNTFPWPDVPTHKHRAAVEERARDVLSVRNAFPDCSLADLYDPRTMPPKLVKAHSELDHAVDLCYRPQAFENDRQRVEYLFTLYEKLASPLLPPAAKSRKKKPG